MRQRLSRARAMLATLLDEPDEPARRALKAIAT
jgi:hypothetical protein